MERSTASERLTKNGTSSRSIPPGSGRGSRSPWLCPCAMHSSISSSTRTDGSQPVPRHQTGTSQSLRCPWVSTPPTGSVLAPPRPHGPAIPTDGDATSGPEPEVPVGDVLIGALANVRAASYPISRPHNQARTKGHDPSHTHRGARSSVDLCGRLHSAQLTVWRRAILDSWRGGRCLPVIGLSRCPAGLGRS